MGKKWLEPWEEIPNADILFFKEQLVKEITLSHTLFGRQLLPIGRSSANDDILISIGSGKFAVVHLMWSNSGDHLWPTATRVAVAQLSIEVFGLPTVLATT